LSNDVPTATLVKDGKVPGDVPPRPGARSKHKRRLANYLINKGLQLRYVVRVLVLSALIAGALGWMIYQQEHQASEDLVAGLADLTQKDEGLADFEQKIAEDLRARDRTLVLEMAGLGVSLVLILSLYLVFMTHKVAGPLFKVSHYFDDMAAGRIGPVTSLRKGDMLQDFFASFRESHDAVRKRLTVDADAMQRLVDAARAAGVTSGTAAGDEIEALAKHVERRRQALR